MLNLLLNGLLLNVLLNGLAEEEDSGEECGCEKKLNESRGDEPFGLSARGLGLECCFRDSAGAEIVVEPDHIRAAAESERGGVGGVFFDRHSGQRAVNDFAEGIVVVRLVVFADSGENFGREESGRAGKADIGCVGDEPDVAQNRGTVDPQDIVGLEVAVEESAAVQRFQICNQFIRHLADGVGRETPLFSEAVCKSVGDVFALFGGEIVGGVHGVPEAVIALFNMVDLEQICARTDGLILDQTVEFPFAGASLGIDDLESDAAFREGVFREENGTVCSLPAFAEKSVCAECVADFIAQFVPPDRLRCGVSRFFSAWRCSGFFAT